MTAVAKRNDARTTKLNDAIKYAKHSYEYVVELKKLSKNATAVADFWLLELKKLHVFDLATNAVKSKTRFGSDFVEKVVKIIGQAVYRALFDTDGDFKQIAEIALKDGEVAYRYNRYVSATVAMDEWIVAAIDSGPVDRTDRADALYRLRANIPDGDDLKLLKEALIRASRKHLAAQHAVRLLVAASAKRA